MDSNETFHGSRRKRTNNNNNLTLGGLVASAARAVSKLASEGGELGLALNIYKCELIAHDDVTIIGDSSLGQFNSQY